MQATRNSHQFAAVVGTVTAWNFAEWAAALEKRRMLRNDVERTRKAVSPRLTALGAVVLVLVWVGTGQFYKMAGEGRTIGLGEEPLWFPHEAARFAGQAGMPDRFLAFHIGHAALFEYYHGPERKVYIDPRLEVIGAELFATYTDLEKRISEHQLGWEEALDKIGPPVILADHEYSSGVGAALMASDHWRCVWFDAIAAVFVHDSYATVVKEHSVDFAARHFQGDPASEPAGSAELTALARAYRKYVPAVAGAGGRVSRPLVWLGLDVTRRIPQPSLTRSRAGRTAACSIFIASCRRSHPPGSAPVRSGSRSVDLASDVRAQARPRDRPA